jgi:hypothetical protein
VSQCETTIKPHAEDRLACEKTDVCGQQMNYEKRVTAAIGGVPVMNSIDATRRQVCSNEEC